MMGASIAGFNGGVIGAILGALLGAMIGAGIMSGRRRGAELRETGTHSLETGVSKPADRDLADASLSRRTDGLASSAVRGVFETADRSGVVRVPLAEERLDVDKREIEAGLVRLRKVVKTEVVHLPVELRREEIIVERVEPGAAASAVDGETHAFGAQQGDEIVIPLVKEEAIIQKQSKVFSEVRVHKITHTETKQIHETIRREDVVVEQPNQERRA